MKPRFLSRIPMKTGPDTVLYYKLHEPPTIDSVGSETILNGDFAAGDTGWTVGANWATGTGKAVHTAGDTATLVSTGTAPVPGNVYRVIFTLSNRTVGNVAVSLGGVSGGAFTANQQHVVYITPTGATKLTFAPVPGTFDGSIDDVSVMSYARIVFDYSLNDNPGTMKDTQTTPTLRARFPGYAFDGSNNFIDVGNEGNSIKSVVLWVNPARIVGNDYPIDLNGTDYLSIETGTLTKNGFAGGTTVLYTDGVAAATTITANWHFIAITDTSAKTASDLDIGQVGGVGFFTGLIGEVLLSTSVLTVTDIVSLYQTSRGRYGV